MWGAIKSDLFEFISTVQEDAQETISKVVDIQAPRTAEEGEKITEDERVLSEFRNNFATYSEDVEPEQQPEFEKFLKGFSLSSKAEEIEYILELESGVTKHYAALVPAQMTPDLFWARYFFKVNILIISSLGSVLESAYEEEEELSWGEDDDDDQDNIDNREGNASSLPATSSSSPSLHESSSQMKGNLLPPVDVTPNDTVQSKAEITKENVAEEVAMLAASNITRLQEENSNLSTRAVMLEGEVEKLQNQMIKERTVSAKLRTSLTQSEEREKRLTEQVMDLKMKLAAAVAEKEELEKNAKIEAAPMSSGSSIVDLGADQSQLPPRQDIASQAKTGIHSDDQLGPSVSALSLASLQSVSSVSVSDDSSPSSTTRGKSPSSTASGSGVNTASDKKSADRKEVKGTPGGEVEEDEEEEWDNEAWE